MKHASLFFASVLATSIAAACSSSDSSTTGTGGASGSPGASGAAGSSGSAGGAFAGAAGMAGSSAGTAGAAGASGVGGGAAGTAGAAGAGGALDGLPCGLADMLSMKCNGCHGDPQAGGAVTPLTTYGELTAPSAFDPTKTVAQVALDRMQTMDAMVAMPPKGTGLPPAATDAEIKLLSDWIAAGTPADTCTATTGPNPYGTPTVCTSGKMWTTLNVASALMLPGANCVSCHKQQGGPPFYVGGTVYPSAHEPDNCVGLGGVKVVITDANGNVFTIPVQANGNFYLWTQDPLVKPKGFKTPYSVKVTKPDGTERHMTETQTNGDCNSCHTAAGNGAGSLAPGRIMAPLVRGFSPISTFARST